MWAVLPELGLLALCACVAVSAIMGGLLLRGAATGERALVTAARPLAVVQSLLACLAFAALMLLFADNDFSVRYVVQQSSSQLPLVYRLAAVWGGHEGSLLLWLLLLCVWTLAVALCSRSLDDAMRARLVAIMGLIAAGFGFFLLLTSNPFARLDIPAVEGRELNPMLQDPGLIVHPPLLYMGYVGFAVAFAMALAGLMADGSMRPGPALPGRGPRWHGST